MLELFLINMIFKEVKKYLKEVNGRQREDGMEARKGANVGNKGLGSVKVSPRKMVSNGKIKMKKQNSNPKRRKAIKGPFGVKKTVLANVQPLEIKKRNFLNRTQGGDTSVEAKIPDYKYEL